MHTGKSVVLPVIKYGEEIINYTKDELNAIQKAENRAYRYIMNAPHYTPIAALRGEIGASSHIARDMKTKLNFIRHIIQDGNQLLKTIFDDIMERSRDPWAKTVNNYIREMNLNITKIGRMKKEEINHKIRQWDSECWRAELETKKTLETYRKHKIEIKTETSMYDNTIESDILFQVRTNTLNLGWRKKHKNEDTTCQMCKIEEEDLQHFLLYCPELQRHRNSCTYLQQPYNSNILETIMLFNSHAKQNEIKRTILQMWNHRKNSIKQQQ